MFLSQLEINPRSSDARRDLADPYDMHRTLCRAFGDKAELEAARLLYRVDALANGATAILVQTKTKPHWSALPASYCLNAPQTKEWQPQFQADQMLSFRLRANPTKADASNRGEKRNRGKRVGLFKTEERRDWLLRRAEACGFWVPTLGELEDGSPLHDFRLTDEKVCRATPDGPKKSSQAILSAALFDGRLIVREPDKFLAALQNGIGPAKAFGFGLLSLSKMR